MKKCLILANFFICLCVVLFSKFVECRYTGIHSDAIVTHWPAEKNNFQTNYNDLDENEPGWMRQQLIKFGEVASNIGNTMGEHATVVSKFVDKLCEIVKTLIPLLAAICHVGEFSFCEATNDAPAQLKRALNPASLDLDELDRR